MSETCDDTPQQPQKKKILIFVHGMYGSNLIHKETGEHAWLSRATVLGNLVRGNRSHFQSRISPKKISWSADDKVHDRDDLYPQSPLDMFTKPWDEWCASLDTNIVDVRNFLWDWRRPLDETCEAFRQWVLQQGLSEHNRAVLASYSTASLFVWPIVNQHPYLFSGWLDIGGAIGGGNFILNDFNNGWYKKPICLLSAEVVFTIPSLYVFFAAQGEPTGASRGDFLFQNPDTRKEVPSAVVGDMYSVHTWRTHNLGIFGIRKKQGRVVSEEEEKHVRNSLASASRFRQAHYVREGATSFEDPSFLIHPDASYEHLDLCHFGSEAHNNTHCGWYYNHKNEAKGGKTDGTIFIDPSRTIQGNGDGTIMTWAWKIRMGGLPNHRVVHCSNDKLVHVELMTDPKVQATAAEMLGIQYVGSGTAVPTRKKHEKHAGLIGGLGVALVALVGIVCAAHDPLSLSSASALKVVLGLGIVVAALACFVFPRQEEPAHDPSTSAILITGGSRGIGRSTADYLFSKGYSVLVTVRKQSQYDELVEAFHKSNKGSPYPVLLDVTNDSQVPAAMKQLRAFLTEHNKKLVALVNNAGINPEGEKMTEAYSKGQPPEAVLADPSVGSRVFETNVVGVGRITKACLPLLTKGGRIVNIGSYFGSIAGKGGLCHCYYEASKFALEGMTANMRRTLKEEKGIIVSLIKPGNIDTEMNSVGEVSADVVAMDIEHAIASPRPRPRYYPGLVKGYSAKNLCLMFEMLPTWLTDKL